MNKQKGFSTLWGIIILLVIAGGVYYFVSKNVSEDVLKENITNTEQIDETENVKTETTPENISSTQENNDAEIFNFQPANILSVKEMSENLWILEVDLLTYNTDWVPGSVIIPKYINQNPKIRQLYINKNTKIHNCEWNYKTESYNFDYNQKDEVEKIERMVSRYKEEGYEGFWTETFSIVGSEITAVHEQCAG
jgi:hypothetical protein